MRSVSIRIVYQIRTVLDCRVNNVVFVLLVNRDQLEKAVKGVYGSETDAAAYLGKFVNFFFFLQKQTSIGRIDNVQVKAYVSFVFNRYNFEKGNEPGDFKEIFSAMASAYKLSLRDVEKAIALYSFAQPVPVARHLLAYVITLKVAKGALFGRLVKGEIVAHEEARKIVDQLQQELDQSGGRGWPLLLTISEWHTAHISGFKDVGENFQKLEQGLWQFDLSLRSLFSYLAGRIDLPIEI